jgi:hypothetical protein
MTDDTNQTSATPPGPVLNFYTLVPYATSAPTPTTPQNQPAINGGATLTLSVCNFLATGYTVSNPNNSLVYYVIVLPAVLGS